MERGTERDTPPGAGNGAGAAPATAGRVPLAAVVADRDGLVSHWSGGARRLFGVPEEEAVGRPAVDLLPVLGALPEEDDAAAYGAYRGPGPGPSPGAGPPRPAAGRARLTVPGQGRADVLWWGYPLLSGPERLLVLAADADLLRRAAPGEDLAFERVAPGFAPHTDFPGADGLARGLPEVLPGLDAGGSTRIAARVLELGCPVLECGRNDRVPVIPDWGAPRRAEQRARCSGTRNRR
ncbi:hypothetical protein GCM10010421_39600 [Streptomyces glaucus]|uniref:PAS domain-containing protein n=1 Tax=Streptomyces glaucus TaxID=284029 RepID=A0ABP5X7D1_9ACTN